MATMFLKARHNYKHWHIYSKLNTTAQPTDNVTINSLHAVK